MIEILKKIEQSTKRILVVGDMILDRYIYGSVERVSPEAAIPVLSYEGKSEVPGGAANVAHNIAALGMQVSILGVVGDDGAGDRLVSMLEQRGIDTSPVFRDETRKTTEKTRIVAQNHQQLIRIDSEITDEISAGLEEKLLEYFRGNAGCFDVIMISDYNKGVVTGRLCREMIRYSRQIGIKAIVDPKARNTEKYAGAYLIKPNKKELATLFGGKTGSGEEMVESIRRIRRLLETDVFVVTTGEEGMVMVDDREKAHVISAEAKQVFDVTGAGDTTFAVLGVCIANNIPLVQSIKLANITAGIKVKKPGVKVVSLAELYEEIRSRNALLTRKIIGSSEELDLVLRNMRERNQKIVFTNGCFDVLHFGHVSYLSKAKALGDILIVGVNSDSSIKRIKGERRPIIRQSDRVNLLASLEFIDYVVVFDEDTPIELIKTIGPHVLVKGSDWRPEEVVGREVVEAAGGKVELITLEEGISTTEIIRRIVGLYGGKE